MKKLLSCAAVLFAVALVGCSKSNKTDNTTVQNDNSAALLPAGFVVEGEQLLDSAGNVVATAVDGAFVDAKGKVIGTVEAVEAQYQSTKEKAAELASQAADSVKNVAANVKESVENKATEIVDNAKEKGAKVVDKVKDGVANTLDKTGEALQNGAKKLSD